MRAHRRRDDGAIRPPRRPDQQRRPDARASRLARGAATSMCAAVIDLNARSVVSMTRAAVPWLERKGGFVINTTSIAARNGGGGGAVLYAAAKGFVSTLTRRPGQGTDRQEDPSQRGRAGRDRDALSRTLLRRSHDGGDAPNHSARPRRDAGGMRRSLPVPRLGGAQRLHCRTDHRGQWRPADAVTQAYWRYCWMRVVLQARRGRTGRSTPASSRTRRPSACSGEQASSSDRSPPRTAATTSALRRMTQRRVVDGGRSATVKGLPSGPITYLTLGRIASLMERSLVRFNSTCWTIRQAL